MEERKAARKEEQDQEAGPSRPAAPAHAVQAPQRRRAVPPGYLGDLLLARQKMKSMGVSATGNALALAPARGAGGSGGAGGGGASALRQVPYVPVNTLPLLFAQRKKFLQRSKLHTPQPYQRLPGEPAGLLSLPEDALLKIVCHLRHAEIKPMFLVCKTLRNTLKEAVHFHFNFSTPFRPGVEEQRPGEPRPERNRKRAVTNLAVVMAQLQRGPRLAAAIARGNPPAAAHAAPRALSFKDSSAPGPS